MYIAGWKRLGNPDLVKNAPHVVLKKFVVKPDQWVIVPLRTGNIKEYNGFCI